MTLGLRAVALLLLVAASAGFTSRLAAGRRSARLMSQERSYSISGGYPRPPAPIDAQGAREVSEEPFVSTPVAAVMEVESPKPKLKEVNKKKTLRVVKITREGSVDDAISSLVGGPVTSSGAGGGDSHTPKKSIMLFLPGLDGQGSYSQNTLLSLTDDYDVYRLEIKGNDRSTFREVSDFVIESIRKLEEEHPDVEEIVLAGESFGGLVASFVSARMQNDLMKLLLINPATSYKQTVWPTIGPLLTQAPESLFPFLGIGVLMTLAVEPSQITEIGQQIVNRINSTDDALRELQTLTDSAGTILDILPQDTLDWRLREWLGKGIFLMEDRYDQINNPTLLLIGRNDRLLPSSLEGTRLRELLTGVSPAATGSKRGGPEVMEVVAGGHALLDGSLDLSEVLRKSDTFQRAHSTPLSSPQQEQHAQPEAQAQAQTQTKEKNDSSFLDGDLRVPYPTKADMQDVEERFGGILRSVSPVFLSLDPRGSNPRLVKYGIKRGTVQKGLRSVPVSKEVGRPVLLVGNHQLYGADLAIIVKAFIDQKETLIRGLAHPLLFRPQNGTDATSNTGPTSSASIEQTVDEVIVEGPVMPAVVKLGDKREGGRSESSNRRRGRRGDRRAGGGGQNSEDIGDLFRKFGAVEVRADNMYQLLASDETVLLFPGGVKEAYHKKGEDYEVFWPEKTDFIRMATLHGAIVVPFCGIGVADSFNMLLDRDDILANPLLAGRAKKSLESIPQARAGGAEQFLAPISVPRLKGPARQYFMFGEAFDTQELDLYDKQQCKAAYTELQGRVKSMISLLKDVRDNDPYSDFVPRSLYEGVTNQQAPVDLRKIVY